MKDVIIKDYIKSGSIQDAALWIDIPQNAEKQYWIALKLMNKKEVQVSGDLKLTIHTVSKDQYEFIQKWAEVKKVSIETYYEKHIQDPKNCEFLIDQEAEISKLVD